MVKIVIALCMMMNGEVVEHMYKNSISECLKSKRIAERNTSDSVQWMCGEVEAIVEEDWNSGQYRILEIKESK
jgi:hypothetical protein